MSSRRAIGGVRLDLALAAQNWPSHHSATAKQYCPSSSAVARQGSIGVCQTRLLSSSRVNLDGVFGGAPEVMLNLPLRAATSLASSCWEGLESRRGLRSGSVVPGARPLGQPISSNNQSSRLSASVQRFQSSFGGQRSIQLSYGCFGEPFSRLPCYGQCPGPVLASLGLDRTCPREPRTVDDE